MWGGKDKVNSPDEAISLEKCIFQTLFTDTKILTLFKNVYKKHTEIIK